MNHYDQRHIDAFGRGQHYLDDQASDVTILKDCNGRKQLDDAMAQIAVAIHEQGTAVRQMDGQWSRQRSLEAELRYRHMQPIATFARAMLQGVPGFGVLTRSTLKLRPKLMVQAAQAMATAAAPHADALAKGGLRPDCIARLAAAADALEAVIEDRANTRIARVRATKDIREQVQRGRQALKMLHAAVSNQLGDDATFMTGWNTARRVGRKAGGAHSARTTTTTPATPPATTQTTPAPTVRAPEAAPAA